MRISDWSSDVCSSDLKDNRLQTEQKQEDARSKAMKEELEWVRKNPKGRQAKSKARIKAFEELSSQEYQKRSETKELYIPPRSEEHTSELQSLMRISYAVFCLKKNKNKTNRQQKKNTQD